MRLDLPRDIAELRAEIDPWLAYLTDAEIAVVLIAVSAELERREKSSLFRRLLSFVSSR